jgi:hypothetical protein
MNLELAPEATGCRGERIAVSAQRTQPQLPFAPKGTH